MKYLVVKGNKLFKKKTSHIFIHINAAPTIKKSQNVINLRFLKCLVEILRVNDILLIKYSDLFSLFILLIKYSDLIPAPFDLFLY